MKISNRAYLGVECMVRLSACYAGKPCTVQELAWRLKRSVSYMETLMAQLREAGLVKAKRGLGGGYFLTRTADRITVAEIVQAFDEQRDLDGRPVNATTLEPEDIYNLHGTELLWESLKSHILLFLSGVSLADIIPATDGVYQGDNNTRAAIFGDATDSVARH
jgi:Rrf2 family iron-sulfur cluster assembly transcriptional regulator